MNWIRVSTEISRDAQIKQLARALSVKRAEVIGCVTALLTHLPAHAPDGNLSAIDDADLEEFAVWERKRGAFATLFRSTLCDERGVVRSWEKYNGAALREAEAARTRMADRRRLKRIQEEQTLADSLAKSSPNRSPNGSPDGTPNGSPERSPPRTYERNERDVRTNKTELPDSNAEGKLFLSGASGQRAGGAPAAPPTSARKSDKPVRLTAADLPAVARTAP